MGSAASSKVPSLGLTPAAGLSPQDLPEVDALSLEIDLPAALERFLSRVKAVGDRAALQRLFSAVIAATERLGELDLAGLDRHDVVARREEIWEALTLAMAETIHTSREVVAAVRAELPLGDVEEAAALDAVFGESGEKEPRRDVPREEGMLAKVARVLRDPCLDLEREERALIAEGQRPVRADALWDTLARVVAARGRIRSILGDGIHGAAQLLGPVGKEDVVPHHRAEMEGAVALRRGIVDLRDRVRASQLELEALARDEHHETLRAWLGEVHRELEVFAKSEAYRQLRPADRRGFLGISDELESYLSSGAARFARLRELIDSLAALLDGMSGLSRRAVLVEHDRNALARARRHLVETTRGVLAYDTEAGRKAFQATLEAARCALGRDPDLDDAVRVLSRLPIPTLELTEILAAARLVGRHLDGVDDF